MNPFKRFLDALERRPFHPAPLFFAVLAVGIGRAVEEIYFAHATLGFSMLSQYGAFYLATFMGFTTIAAILLKGGWEKISQAVVLGIFWGLLPPLIDVFWKGPGQFQYYYLDRFYPTLHGAGNSYSEAITAWSALATFAAYLWLKSRSFLKTVLGLALGYAYVLLLVGSYKDLGDKIFDFLKEGMTRGYVFLFIAYALYVALNFRRLWPSLKRVNHSLPWVALVFLGAALAGQIEKMTWLQAVVVLLVHQGAVFANDYYDREADQLNGRSSPIVRNDVLVMNGLTIWLALQVCFTNSKLGYLYLLYLLATTAYHHPLLRLKNVFPLNYAIEGLVAALALLIGMASTGRYQLSGAELGYVGLAFAGFAVASTFKDYKDIEGDRATGARTLYVLLMQRGWALPTIHALVSALVLGFAAAPLVFLGLKRVPLPVILALSIGLVLPIFFGLWRGKKKSAAVERTAWLIAVYQVALIFALRLAPPPVEQGILRDYGNLIASSETYASAHPASLDEVANLVRKANVDRTPLRVRGKAHSMNGSSLPRRNELLISTDRLRDYRFGEPGSITVQAGIGMYELRAFLQGRGMGLPVTNDGSGGPSVGGYIAAGGIGPGSRQYGGFWENVLEITLVTGAGDVLTLKPGDELFPWMFGSMGQLGIVVSAKLKILDGETRGYPLNEKGTLPPRKADDPRHLYWFTVFVPKDDVETVKAELAKIQEAHPESFTYRPAYVYPIAFVRFNPKLVFPRDQEFAGVGIWGFPKSADPETSLVVEREIMALVRAHADRPYRRYIQTEIVSSDTDYEGYFGKDVYGEFLAIKKKLDPNALLDCGTIFACIAR